MKIVHAKPTKAKPYPRWFFYGETPEELRIITIFRDLLGDKEGARLRFEGATKMGKQVAGLPNDPCSAMCLSLEDPTHRLPDGLEGPDGSLDPQRPIPPPTPPASTPRRLQRRIARGGPGMSTTEVDLGG